MKLNTDDMAQGAPGRLAVGVVFRDHMEVVMGAYFFSGGISMAFFAEISALIQGIKYAISVVGADFGLSLIRWWFFSAFSPPLICLFGLLSRGGITASYFSLTCVFIALISTKRVMMWQIVLLL